MPSETFSGLSLDPRHSRYVEAVLGSTTGPLRPEDRRPEGESVFVRADDQAVNTADAIARIRLGPDVLVEETPLGERRAAARGLAGGTDSPAGIAAATFVGTDSVEPQLRTGLFTLRNEELISLVAVPGRSDPDVQMQVIAHCQQMRYRFAVLDSVPGSDPRRGAGLDEVRAQRNRYDTRYAAFYYPWVIVRDVRPPEGRPAQELAIPPSGHVLGVYADTDVRRGVHKAPANVVLDSVLRLQRRLTKAEHDLLNPSPVNINVLRDFRDVSRGLRVYGARCITSDTNWKYVNVRRLFLFLEQSLDIGTQYVVFEPNDAPLWARVRQSIATFLTRVWRDGALMGATPEEAFFVRCDRTTMTQDDIDNGRLIILIGVAPVKPAEFVIVRIGQWAGGSAVQEL
jgi:phage tail sheath protein FI